MSSSALADATLLPSSPTVQEVTTACKPSAPDGADSANPPVGALFATLYADLCRLARREVGRGGVNGLLSTATLVHETWLSIERRPSLAFSNKGQFLAYAARAMRGLVIDRVRVRHSQKRGGGMIITSLDTHNADQVTQPEDLDNLSEALDELSALEPDLAHVVDLKFFCGFSIAEVATMQGVSTRTVLRKWEKARLLLFRSLNA
jgi:RNA polymerase sigma factor (TIGR02999 family)